VLLTAARLSPTQPQTMSPGRQTPQKSGAVRYFKIALRTFAFSGLLYHLRFPKPRTQASRDIGAIVPPG
jgi:hypothetical protein